MKYKPFGLVLAALLTIQHAPAAIVVTDLGDRGDGYNVVQIVYDGSGDNTGTWSVPSGVSTVELMVIGGGGAGGRGGAFGGPSGGSPGGGAGGLYYTTSLGVAGTVNLAVGIGAATTAVNGNGASGGNTVFGEIIAYGGQGGNTSTNQGGNQGGFSLDNGNNITPGFLGGTGNGATGGAGATQNGRNGGFSPAYGGAGASHTTVPITGDFGVIGADGNPISGNYGNMIGYAGGGSAGYDGVLMGSQYGESYGGGSGSEPEGVAGTAGFDALGGGGGGGRSANGGGGGDGVIYIAYIPEPSSALLGGLGLLALLRRRRA